MLKWFRLCVCVVQKVYWRVEAQGIHALSCLRFSASPFRGVCFFHLPKYELFLGGLDRHKTSVARCLQLNMVLYSFLLALPSAGVFVCLLAPPHGMNRTCEEPCDLSHVVSDFSETGIYHVLRGCNTNTRIHIQYTPEGEETRTSAAQQLHVLDDFD